MTSFQITLTSSRREAARFVTRVRRAIQKALAEEKKKSGLSQSDIARAIGVHRSVINREIRGQKDLTLGRVAELAWALGRRPNFDMPEQVVSAGANTAPLTPIKVTVKSDTSGSFAHLVSTRTQAQAA